jgi:Transglycosylase SLT domain
VAGEIFVGSVAVSVVPDLRGFNDEVRRQLVPSSDAIGREIGKAISQGIVDSLDFGDIVSKATAKSLSTVKAEGYSLGLAYGSEMRRGIEDSLKDITATVKLSVDESSLAKLRTAADLTGGLGVAGAGGKIPVDIGESKIVRLSEQIDALNRALGVGAAISGVGTGTSRGRTAANVGLQGILSTILTSAARDASEQVARDAARTATTEATRGGEGAAGAAANVGLVDLLRGNQLASVGQLFTSLPLPAQLGIGGTALAGLPFLAQILSGGGIGLLGAGLAGLGIAGATGIGATTPTAGQAATAAQFSKLSASAQADLAKIGTAFIPVMDSIFSTATSVLGKLTPVFAGAERTIAGPFQTFADTIIRTFDSPQVTSSVQAVAKAFAGILTALTPDIPGIMNSFADAIERMANAVSKNPKAFADFINFFFQVIIAIIDAIAFLTDFADYIEFHFTPAVQHFVNFWIDVGHDIEASWDTTWNNTVSRTTRGIHDVETLFDEQRHDVAARVDQTGADINNYWNSIWNNTIGRAIRGVNDLIGIFGTIRGRVVNTLSSAGDWLVGIGESIIQGMLSGIDKAMAGVGSWLKSHVVDPIINAVKHFFGISSPSTVMIPIGANIMQGVVQGMLTSGSNLGNLIKNIFGGWPQALGSLVSKSLVDVAKLPSKALNALESVAGKIGGAFGSIWHKVFGGSGGVNQWAGTVMQALSMLHLPMSLLGQVLYQMQTESGGNPNAINLTDINAQMGDPSRGLLQVIGSTFSAFHVAGTSGNIYDPLANVAAAINYAMHTYGPTLMRGGMGMGSGHGYDAGGYAPPGASWFWNGTGKPEPVLTDSQWNAIYSAARGGDGGTQYHAHFDGLTYAAIESHVQTAFKAMSLTAGALNRQGRRS